MSAFAQNDITPGMTFVDGQRLTAAQLGLLVSGASINTSFYTGKTAQTNLNPTDIILVYSAASGTFHKLTGSQALFQNPALIYTQPLYSSVQNTNYYVLGYDSTNGVLFQVNITNVLAGASPFIIASQLNFSNTITAYTPAQPDPNYQTNALQLVCFDTNGIPHSITVSNLMHSFFSPVATNEMPFVYNQIFKPASFYGTNATPNVWLASTNFAITSLFTTNSAGVPTNVPTLADSDTVPIGSSQQFTNTTATLQAIYQYLTNKNTLPPYTQARIQFVGDHASFLLTNSADTTHYLIQTVVTNFVTNAVYAVSFITNGVQYWAGMTTNQVYYVVPQTTNASFLSVYSNYASASQSVALGYQSNNIPIISTSAGAIRSTMLYLTNLTSFNCDVVPVVVPGAPASVRTGVYDVWFRNYPANNLYYVTGTTTGYTNANQLNAGAVTFSYDQLIQTNFVRLETLSGNSAYEPSLVHVLIQPQ